MKKTLHVTSLSRKAGLEVMFLNFLKQMSKEQPESMKYQYVFAIGLSDYFRDELNKLGVTVYVAEKRAKYDLSIFKQINNVIESNEIKVLYGQNFAGNALVGLISIRHPSVRVICHEHGTSWNASGVKSLLTLLWVKQADNIICNSNAAKVLLQKRFKASDKKLVVILNGVPLQTELGYKKNNNRIVFAGRLDFVKSPITLIYMMNELIKSNLDVHLDILGDGVCLDSLIDLTEQLNLSDRIHFHGNVDNVREFMSKASLLILPSIREALGNVTMEAAFQKTPTVATCVDGIPEVIIHNKTGILIRPTEALEGYSPVKYVVDLIHNSLMKPKRLSPRVLAKEVEELLSDKEKLELMGQNAYLHIKNNFSIERYYAELVEMMY
ncbi:glycosyltransferase family 1 protein [Salibacterium salarium]|uniref:Glycosyltransferase family 1 protein n=1 Tax=Salibacterium salarium TaxID=284579 RepID=A0A428MUG2_9BACI|nr:glycosyltransferase family 4 protein [Salibacterium salarium]RSL29768.1 glycosyltransferase family 1 protein [Salibacterium salarium]